MFWCRMVWLQRGCHLSNDILFLNAVNFQVAKYMQIGIWSGFKSNNQFHVSLKSRCTQGHLLRNGFIIYFNENNTTTIYIYIYISSLEQASTYAVEKSALIHMHSRRD